MEPALGKNYWQMVSWTATQKKQAGYLPPLSSPHQMYSTLSVHTNSKTVPINHTWVSINNFPGSTGISSSQSQKLSSSVQL